MKEKFQTLALLLSALSFPAAVCAGSYSLDWLEANGGAGTSAGTQFALSGRVGKMGPSVLQGSRFSLTGSFRGMLAVVPTPGAPPLAIARTSANNVVVSWPSPSTGFVLQQTTTLAPPVWSDVAQAPADDGTTRSVVLNSPTGNRFFRLVRTTP